MKYVANPVEVHAFVIEEVVSEHTGHDGTGYLLKLSEQPHPFSATPAMCARMKSAVGDYWVIQADGYAYLNPKDVFERKYSPVTS